MAALHQPPGRAYPFSRATWCLFACLSYLGASHCAGPCFALDGGDSGSKLADDKATGALGASEVQRKLSLIDSHYLTGCSLSGVETVEPSLFQPGVGPYKLAWRTTRSPTEFAYESRVDGKPKLQYVPRGQSSFADYDEQGNLLIAFPEEQRYYFGEAQRVHNSRLRSYRVTPTNEVSERGTSELVDVCLPDDPGPTLVMKKALWAAGRGFSPFLESITSVRADKDLISVSATGSDGPNSHGIWSLTIDRSAAYLVVEGSYTRDGRTSPTLALKNSGRRSKADCVVSASSVWTTFVGVKASAAVERTAATFEVDQEFLTAARSAALGPYPKMAQVIDRGLINRKERAAETPLTAADAGRGRRLSYLIAVNAIVIGTLLAIWAIRSWRRAAAQKRHPT